MALLLATMAGAGYFLNKNIQDPVIRTPMTTVPANSKMSGIDIYDSRRYLETQGAIEKEADSRFLKGFRAEETKMIPTNYNQIFSKQVRGTNNLGRPQLPSELMTGSAVRKAQTDKQQRIQREYNSQYSVFDKSSELLASYPEVNIAGVAGRNSSQAQKNTYIANNAVSDTTGIRPQIVGETGIMQGQFSGSDAAKFGVVLPGQNPKTQANYEGFSATISGPQRNHDAPFHNNMVPHFGSHVRQNVHHDHTARLESFTGNIPESSQFRMVHKKELERDSMFAPSSGFTYPYGTPNVGGYGRDRYITSELKTNTLPTEQTRVGPGLNQKDNTESVDGFHPVFRPSQYSVDDIRIASNPKLTYRGRLIRGAEEATGRRGFTGNVYKNNPDTFYVNNPDRYFTTAVAGSLKPKMETKESYATSFGPTSRQQTSTEYAGSQAAVDSKRETSYDYAYNRQDPRRTSFLQTGPSNVSAEDQAGVDYDYGRSGKYGAEGTEQSGYYAVTQERATTEGEMGSYRSNVSDSSAGTMPFFDTSRSTIKQTTLIGGSREKSGPSTNANMRHSMPFFDKQKTTKKQMLEGMGGQREVSGATTTTSRPTMKPFDNAKRTKVETLPEQDATGHVSSKQTQRHTTRLYDTAKVTKGNTLPEWMREASGPSTSVGMRSTTRPYTVTRARKQIPDFLREGGIGTSQSLLPTDHLAYDNAENTAEREVTLVQRRPVREGVKTWIGGDSINVQLRDKVLYSQVARNVDAEDSGVIPGNKQWTDIPTKFNTGMTSIVSNKLDSESRSQPFDWLVSAHQKNPYTQSLTSVAGY